MKTEIQKFCTEFTEELSPLQESLSKTLTVLRENQIENFRESAQRLQEVKHQLTSLEQKLIGQQGYLLIFGPLKSGKSTLMNALSGTYVSEVSSLPAYPSMVYVNHGDEKKFSAQTYSGESIDFADESAMRDAVQAAHESLAQSLLEIERTGQEFDPQIHHADAIRRIDVEIKSKNLADSGIVLVDTPGLYSRMKFGYDLMTREFKDTASCAIFVVKTDNLFFEKVFEEFNQLLGCFSRIFLVANIDKSKKDLNPDGSLQPSLESRSPESVIKAFKSLSMSAPLQDAMEDGRLNVYTIDLLDAAREHLTANQPGAVATEEVVEEEEVPSAEEVVAAGGEAEVEEVEGNEVSSEVVGEEAATEEIAPEEPEVPWGSRFEHLTEDLAEYLNSSDYLHDFMHDSLSFGDTLAANATSLINNDASQALRVGNQKIHERAQQVRSKLTYLKDLEEIDWDAAFDAVHTEKDRILHELSQKYAARLGTTLQQALDEWMETDESLQALLETHLNDKIKSETADDLAATVKRLHVLLDNQHGGARFSLKHVKAFEHTELDLANLLPGMLRDLGAGIQPESGLIAVDSEQLPIKRNFLDIILFRSEAKLREQLFGEDLTNEISVRKKQQRLVGAAHEELAAMIARFPSEALPSIQKAYIDTVFQQYVTEFREAVRQQIASLKQRLTSRQTEFDGQLVKSREIQIVFDEFQVLAREFTESLGRLRGQYRAEPRIPEVEMVEAVETEEVLESDESAGAENGANGEYDADAFDSEVANGLASAVNRLRADLD